MDTSASTLQRLVSEADSYNSKINTALNAVVEANKGQEPLHSLLLLCHMANDASGKKHIDIARWGREHAEAEHAPAPKPEVPTPTNPDPPPVVIPGMPATGTIVRKGDRFKCPVTETSAHVKVEGPCRPSIAVADGKQVWLGYSVNPGEFIEGQASMGSGAAMVMVPAGVYYLSWKLSPGMGGATNGDVSVY